MQEMGMEGWANSRVLDLYEKIDREKNQNMKEGTPATMLKINWNPDHKTKRKKTDMDG